MKFKNPFQPFRADLNLLAGVSLVLLGLSACGSGAENKTSSDRFSSDLIAIPHSASGTDSAVFHAMAELVFEDTTHDFGTLHEGEVAQIDFHFTNLGKSPAIISNASGSCGCTVPDYPREPIAPGAKGKITVKFHSADRTGHQEKSVTLLTNDKRGIHQLYIKAQVEPRDK